MTGTADTEAPEFLQIYGLEVVVIPTHRPMIRKDMPDLVHLTQADKYKAIIEDIQDCVTRQQPVLVGTTSIESSELLSGAAQEGRRARGAERQAARARGAYRGAGRQPGAVTIATNMAGRGTDIQLGGNFEAEIADLEAAGEVSTRRVARS